MPHYKDPDSKVHFLDDESFVNLLPAGSVKITDAQAAKLTAPSPAAVLQSQIWALESSVTARRMREAALGTDEGWLKAVDDKIAALRAKLG